MIKLSIYIKQIYNISYAFSVPFLYEKILSLGYIRIKPYWTEQDMFYFFNGNRNAEFYPTNKYIFSKRVS